MQQRYSTLTSLPVFSCKRDTVHSFRFLYCLAAETQYTRFASYIVLQEKYSTHFSSYTVLQERYSTLVSFPIFSCSRDTVHSFLFLYCLAGEIQYTRFSSYIVLQERYYSLSARRMSAPELPPIADRERPRPPSRSTSRSSLNQLTAAVSNKNIFTRLTNGAGLHRNHSDSSLKALWSTSQGATQSSASVSSYPSGAGGLGGGGGGGGGTPGPGEYGLAPATLHRSSSRALSWCATDNSAGSVPKLETLFEQKISNNLVHTPSLAAPGTPPHVLENSVHNSSISNHHHHNNSSPQSNAKIPPRSVSVNGVRATDSQEVARMKGRRKRQQSECGAARWRPSPPSSISDVSSSAVCVDRSPTISSWTRRTCATRDSTARATCRSARRKSWFTSGGRRDTGARRRFLGRKAACGG